MSIMEKNLPVAESLSEGDKVRIVTSGGNSKQIDASAIGGGEAFIVYVTPHFGMQTTYTADKTYQELVDAINDGKFITCYYYASGSSSVIRHYSFSELSGGVFQFEKVGFSDADISRSQITIANDDQITYTSFYYPFN